MASSSKLTQRNALPPLASLLACFDCSPDDATVACGSQSGALYMWNTRTGAVESELTKHKHGVLASAWAPTSAMILSADQKGDVLIWG